MSTLGLPVIRTVSVRSDDPRKARIVSALKVASGGSKVTNVTEDTTAGTFSGDCMVMNRRGCRRDFPGEPLWKALGRFTVTAAEALGDVVLVTRGSVVVPPNPSESFKAALAERMAEPAPSPEGPRAPVTRAVVKWWNDSKGYGFLDAEGRDIFAHYTAILGDGFKTLAEGQAVECEVLDGPKGPQAYRIAKLLGGVA